jgi:hypothetical protein
MERWANCPGSVLVSEGVENRSSAYADLGTAAHAIAEYALSNKVRRITAAIDTELKYVDHGEEKLVIITEEIADAVHVYLDHVYTILGSDIDAQLYVEQKFDLSNLYAGLFGTCDCIIWLPRTKELHVIDYKHGAGKAVEVTENKQLRYYAVGAVFSLPGVDPKIINTTIVQPRCKHKDGAIRTEILGVVDLLAWSVELKAAAEKVGIASAAHSDTDVVSWVATFLQEGSHCWWCPARQHDKCPAVRAQTQAKAKQAFS